MTENIFCEYCHMPATAFGFVQSATKSTVCREHTATLLEKRIPIIDLGAFHFIETQRDLSEYEERRRSVEQALGRLDALESQCESDWERHQLRIEKHSEEMHAWLQRTYTEIKLRAQERFTHIKEQLQTTRNRLHRYTQDRSVSLPTEDSAVDTQFAMEVGDCQLSIVETLLSAYSFSPVSSVPAHNLHKELNLLLYLSASEADVSVVAETCEQTSATACKQGHFSAAITELKRGRAFLQRHSRYSLDLPLVRAFFQSQQYAPAISLCEEILQTERSPFESFSAFFYLIESLYDLKDFEQAQEKQPGQLIVDCTDCQCALLYIQARRLLWQNRNKEAKEMYEQALQLNVLSHSYLTAFSLDQLGFLYYCEGNKKQAERLRVRSCAIYCEHFPYAYHYGACLTNLGAIYVKGNRLAEAEERLAKAHQLLSLHFPQSSAFGLCLYHMGRLRERNGEKEAAREKLKASLSLLKKHGLDSWIQKAEKAVKRVGSWW